MSAVSPISPQDEQVPVRRAIRRLRWFQKSFKSQVAQTGDETGIRFEINDPLLTSVFFDWLRKFEAQKPSDPNDRRDFVGFAAGLMLRSLVARDPLKAVDLPENADAANPAFYWPEGYVYVAFCLNIRALVLEQEFHEDRKLVPELTDMRTWWSFRENVSEDQALCGAFLDLFAGDDPQWDAPALFSGRRPAELAVQFYEQRRIGTGPDGSGST